MGRLALVLHGHLPYVRHSDHKFYLEETWFFEAVLDCYLPLINSLKKLESSKIKAVFNLSLSPTLCEMLNDSDLQNRFETYLKNRKQFLIKECNSDDIRIRDLADYYLKEIRILSKIWKSCSGNLLHYFREFSAKGFLNLMICIGTHPFLPALKHRVQWIKGHLQISRICMKKYFDKPTQGVWVPECAYFPGLDQLIKDAGFKYFILESHGVLCAEPTPEFGVYKGLRTKAEAIAWGRDQQSSREVWSREIGYPGDKDYREFHRDLSLECSHDYLPDYFLDNGLPVHSGIKFHAIQTNKIYSPGAAKDRARLHAREFIDKRIAAISRMQTLGLASPIIVAPYDAELFGHWWYEGPEFLLQTALRSSDCKEISLCSLAQLSNQQLEQQQGEPVFSTWGEGGFAETWVNSQNEWIYPFYEKCISLFNKVASAKSVSPMIKRILNQMCREIVLMQSSDWAFMMTHQSSATYASGRVNHHYQNVVELYALTQNEDLDLEQIQKKESAWPFLKEMDYRWFV
jgi:1,4-alpha-glucan branching enzyme